MTEKETLSFASSANVYDSAYWTFVDPDGNEFDLDYFSAHFVQSYIDGYYEPTLTIWNLDEGSCIHPIGFWKAN